MVSLIIIIISSTWQEGCDFYQHLKYLLQDIARRGQNKFRSSTVKKGMTECRQTELSAWQDKCLMFVFHLHMRKRSEGRIFVIWPFLNLQLYVKINSWRLISWFIVICCESNREAFRFNMTSTKLHKHNQCVTSLLQTWTQILTFPQVLPQNI